MGEPEKTESCSGGSDGDGGTFSFRPFPSTLIANPEEAKEKKKSHTERNGGKKKTPWSGRAKMVVGGVGCEKWCGVHEFHGKGGKELGKLEEEDGEKQHTQQKKNSNRKVIDLAHLAVERECSFSRIFSFATVFPIISSHKQVRVSLSLACSLSQISYSVCVFFFCSSSA